MTEPLYRPTSLLVCSAWLRLASGVGVGTRLPDGPTDQLSANGFVRISGVVGGDPGRDVPKRNPVIFAECWVPPDTSGTGTADPAETAWLFADQLAARLLAATRDPALQGRVIDLSTFGSYGPARVHDVIALTEPGRVENDPTDWARTDIDLAFTWTEGA